MFLFVCGGILASFFASSQVSGVISGHGEQSSFSSSGTTHQWSDSPVRKTWKILKCSCLIQQANMWYQTRLVFVTCLTKGVVMLQPPKICYDKGPMMLHLVPMNRSWSPPSIATKKALPISLWRHYDVKLCHIRQQKQTKTKTKRKQKTKWP